MLSSAKEATPSRAYQNSDDNSSAQASDYKRYKRENSKFTREGCPDARETSKVPITKDNNNNNNNNVNHLHVNSTTVKNNQGVPVGILRRHIDMWRWSCNAIDSKKTAARVLQIIEHGVTLEFNEEPPLSSQRHVQRNYVSVDSEEGRWVTKQIRILIHQGSVRHVDPSACLFTLPIFVVPKDGGNGMRMIVDMRELNKLLTKHKFTLPTLARDRIEYNGLLGCWTYDLTSSYQHVEIAQADQKYFGIEWAGQTYLMTVCPYGCSSVPEIFQTVAGIPLRVLEKIGFCPDLTSIKDWQDVAEGAPLPPASRRFRINTKQYLDDYCSLLPPTIRALDGHELSGAALRSIAPRLSRSFWACMRAHGWTISSKSQPEPFLDTTFLGFEVHPSVEGGSFAIPPKKVQRNLVFFKTLRDAKTWTGRETAQLAGRILQWKLVWGAEASLLARPIYHNLADWVRTHGLTAFYRRFTPTSLSRTMLGMVISFLEVDNWTSSPILERRDQLREVWDSGLWSGYAESCGASAPDLLFTDASDLAYGGWLAALHSIEEALAADEHVVRTAQRAHEIQAWSMLSPEALLESSTFRELEAVRLWYSNPEVMNTITSRLQRHNKQGLLHLLDSQAAVNILLKGASGSRRCHLLVIEIFRLTRTLRHKHGLTFAWVPREQNRVADELSKTHDWCIIPVQFSKLQTRFHFTLDGFAASDERADKSLAFCSRFADPASSGNALITSWSGQNVWAYPPHDTRMITRTLHKFRDDLSIPLMALCVPTWHTATWWPTVWNAPWRHFIRLPTKSATKILGLGETGIKQVHATFTLCVFVFAHDRPSS